MRPVAADEIAASLPKTGGRLVGSGKSVVGVGRPSGPQVVPITAVLTKLVGGGVTGVGEPSLPYNVESGTSETGVDNPSAPAVNDKTPPVELTDGTAVTILTSGPVAVPPVPVAFKLVTRAVGVGTPSGPVDVKTETTVGKIGVGTPS